MHARLIFAAAFACFHTSGGLAGPLNPSAGPVTPTPGPEPRIAINATNTPGDADSLFKITQSGSYYLTGNIAGVQGKHGIEIAQWNVTLDLNGFHVNGVAAGTLNGIEIDDALEPRGVTLLNGSVTAWDGDGVDLSTAIGCRVEGIIALNNGGSGIQAGQIGIVARCMAYNNDGTGIGVGDDSSVTQCTASLNDAQGIVAGDNCIISECSSLNSGSSGLRAGTSSIVTRCTVNGSGGDGIIVSLRSIVEACTSSLNEGDGIECNTNCVIRGNNCDFNGTGGVASAGIHATGSGNTIEGNRCSNADRGVDVDGTGNIIIRNTCRGNTTDWVIAGNNLYGPIVDRRVPVPVAFTNQVNGFSAVSTMGSEEDPKANYSY